MVKGGFFMKKQLVACSLLSFGLLVGCNGQDQSQPETFTNDLNNIAEKNNQKYGNPGANQPEYSTNIDNNYDQYELERARPQDQDRALEEGPKKDTPMSDDNANTYNNKEYDRQSRAIGKRLSQSRFIKSAQVVITNESVIVAVEEPDRATYTRVNVSEKVRKLVKEMPEVKGKELVVYTDERYWDRMKDLRSRLNQREEMPEEWDQFSDDYSR